MGIKVVKSSCTETQVHEFMFESYDHDMSVFKCTQCGMEVVEHEDSGTGA